MVQMWTVSQQAKRLADAKLTEERAKKKLDSYAEQRAAAMAKLEALSEDELAKRQERYDNAVKAVAWIESAPVREDDDVDPNEDDDNADENEDVDPA